MGKTFSMLFSGRTPRAVLLSFFFIPAGFRAQAEVAFTVSDPCIWRDDAAKVYRLYQLSRSSDPQGAGVMMRTSTNLVDWSAMKQVLRVPDEYDCAAVWAPEMHFHDGAYYIFGTIATKRTAADCVKPVPGWKGYGDKLRKRLSTYIFKAESPEGPFRVWSEGPITPREWAALDGTLFIEDGKPYMVFCHEWTQVRDGTIEAVELSVDLRRAVGKPFTLFRASDRWGEDVSKQPAGKGYVTDGPWFYRSKTGELFMLWSTGREGYLQLASRSASGKLRGPWTDHATLFKLDSGHGMIFKTFEGDTAIAFHSINAPGSEKRLRVHELIDNGSSLKIGKQIGGDFTPRPAKRFVPATRVTAKLTVKGVPAVTHPPRFAIITDAGKNPRKIKSLFCKAKAVDGGVAVECVNLAPVPQSIRFESDDGKRYDVSVPAGEVKTFVFPAPSARAPSKADALGYVVVTDYVKADGKTDVSEGIQRLIEANPNRTLWFPDGRYLLTKPIATPADPRRSVDLRLSNFAILRASSGWKNKEAMVRLGGIHPANNIRVPGSCYSMIGGVIDGAGLATGVSIDSGRETKIRDVSMKNVRIGIHIKRGANSNSADADISGVNIVGNLAEDSVGVLVEACDNTFTDMRIAGVYTGVILRGASNFLRNVHPLFTGRWTSYEKSVGFVDLGSNNYYDACYSDQFSTGFLFGENVSVLDNCQVFWYAANPGQRHTGIRCRGKFNAMCTAMRIAFKDGQAVNTVLETGKDGGKGYLRDLRMNEKLANRLKEAYIPYKQGSCH